MHRYKTAPDEVYKETIKKRPLGHSANLVAQEQDFPVVRNWLKQEIEGAAGSSNDATRENSSPTMFTRVSIMDLKPDILQELATDRNGQHVCRELAHLYHYYLHGPDGNTRVQRRLAKGSRRTSGISPNLD